MPSVYFRDQNFTLSDIISHFDVADDYLSADAVVFGNDIMIDWMEMILSANSVGIPTLVMQHGLRATREYIDPLNAPLIAEKIMVWGPTDKKRMLQGGVEDDRIIITGTTLFDHLLPRQPHEGINVVFAPMHWDRELTENALVARKLRTINSVNVITKLIDGMAGDNFDNPIWSNRGSNDHLDICASVLSTADLVVSINESTFEFLAYKLDIPVLVVDLWEPKFFEDRLYFPEIRSNFSDACQKVTPDELPQAISHALSNPGEFASERKSALFKEAGVGWNESTPKQMIIRTINESIFERRSRLESGLVKATIDVNRKRLINQMKFKASKSQQFLGRITSNLEDIKSENRRLKLQINKGEFEVLNPLNPLDFPICFSKPLRIVPSAWIAHVPFGMFIVDLLRPRIIVELGTHYGVSYCAFCQAVQELGLNTRAYAIDTWRGDEHAGYYGDEVLKDLQSHHDPLYGEFSRLVPSTFDDAVKYFSDSSIDLLHIDGLHTYEAVKHDFETWLPKLSKRGVILFHDINVRERDFGVWRLWEELSEKFPSFSMIHGYGLGLLAVGEEYPKAIAPLLEMSREELVSFRELFYQLGRRLEVQFEKEEAVRALTTQVMEKEQVVQALTTQVMENEQVVQVLTTQVMENEQTINMLTAHILGINNSISWRLTEPFRKSKKMFAWVSKYIKR